MHARSSSGCFGALTISHIAPGRLLADQQIAPGRIGTARYESSRQVRAAPGPKNHARNPSRQLPGCSSRRASPESGSTRICENLLLTTTCVLSNSACACQNRSPTTKRLPSSPTPTTRNVTSPRILRPPVPRVVLPARPQIDCVRIDLHFLIRNKKMPRKTGISESLTRGLISARSAQCRRSLCEPGFGETSRNHLFVRT